MSATQRYWRRVNRRFNNTMRTIGDGISHGANVAINGLQQAGNTVANGIVDTANKAAQEVAKNGVQVGTDAAIAALMFKNGGRVRAKNNKPVIAMVHGGEYVLPVQVKPSKTQIKKVNALKRKAKSKAKK